MTTAPTPLGHVPALDGVRGLGVLAVMGFHAVLPGFAGGDSGVDVFFVLSGFLITSLLLDEQHRSGRIGLAGFYMRRALRLYPALIVTIVGAIALAWARIPIFDASRRGLDATLEAVPYTLFYTMNIPRAAGWTGGGMLGHAWSLAIEEQFYLLWPPVVIALTRGRERVALLGWLALGGAVASAVARLALTEVGWRHEAVYNATFTHLDGILLGCALAVAWRLHPAAVCRLAHPALAAAALAAGVAVVVVRPDMDRFGYALVVVATAVVIVDIVARPSGLTSRALAHPVPVAIGKRSYGLYLYHWPIFVFVGMDGRLADAALGIGAAFVAAWISYRCIERPFLRRKDRWSWTPRPVPDGARQDR